MKVNNPFDRKLEAQKRIPESIRDAAIRWTDTLDIAWAAAQAVFEKQARPERALELAKLFMARADASNQQLVDELAARTAAESPPPRAQRRRGKAT